MGLVLKPSSIQSQGKNYDANQPDDIELQIILNSKTQLVIACTQKFPFPYYAY
jgi:hypothetical protein